MIGPSPSEGRASEAYSAPALSTWSKARLRWCGRCSGRGTSTASSRRSSKPGARGPVLRGVPCRQESDRLREGVLARAALPRHPHRDLPQDRQQPRRVDRADAAPRRDPGSAIVKQQPHRTLVRARQRESRIWLFGLDPDPVHGPASKVGSVESAGRSSTRPRRSPRPTGSWSRAVALARDRLAPDRRRHEPCKPTHWLKQHGSPHRPTGSGATSTPGPSTTPRCPPTTSQQPTRWPTATSRSGTYEGEWVAAEGQIWSLPDPRSRSVRPVWHRAVAGIDWGFQHAFACEVIVQASAGRRHVVARCTPAAGRISTLIPTLLALRDRWSIEHFYADPSQPGYTPWT